VITYNRILVIIPVSMMISITCLHYQAGSIFPWRRQQVPETYC